MVLKASTKFWGESMPQNKLQIPTHSQKLCWAIILIESERTCFSYSGTHVKIICYALRT